MTLDVGTFQVSAPDSGSKSLDPIGMATGVSSAVFALSSTAVGGSLTGSTATVTVAATGGFTPSEIV